MNSYDEMITRLQNRLHDQRNTLAEHVALVDKVTKIGNPANAPLIKKLKAQQKRQAEAVRNTELELAAIKDLAKSDRPGK